MNWQARLEVHPIVTPTGQTLITLDDARRYLLEHHPDAHAAAGELLKAAEHGGPFLMIARVMVAKAIGIEATPIARRETWREKRKKARR